MRAWLTSNQGETPTSLPTSCCNWLMSIMGGLFCHESRGAGAIAQRVKAQQNAAVAPALSRCAGAIPLRRRRPVAPAQFRSVHALPLRGRNPDPNAKVMSMPASARLFLVLGCIAALLAVVLGAFGA